jgi:parallel beta-helix repeat protein
MVTLLIGTLAFAFEMRQATGRTWYVGPPPSDFTGIQEAIDNDEVLSGDIIEVKWKDKPYYENVTVNKSLIIRVYELDRVRGDYPTVDGGNKIGVVFNVTSLNVEIDGFIIQNGMYGIHISSQSATIRNNTITSNTYGIILSESYNNTLTENKMSQNSFNFGVIGYDVEDYIHNIDESNTVDGKPIIYWLNYHDESVPSYAGYVAIVNSRNITAEKLTLKSNTECILVVNSTQVKIRNLELKYPLTNFETGVELISTTDSRVENVTFQHPSGLPIKLRSSRNNTIVSNEILTQTNPTTGIELDSSDYNLIMDNVITNTTLNAGYKRGISFEHSHDNVAVGNTISTYSYMWHYFMWLIYSNRTIIYHNNFLSSDKMINFGESFETKWDNGAEGNYWSDYPGIDYYSGPYQNETGSDGIGDTQYTIDVNNVDRYPLMNQWSAHRVFDSRNRTTLKPIPTKMMELYTYSNSTLASFNFRRIDRQTGPFGWNFSKGEISLRATCGFDGFVNITIPRIWLDGNFTVMVDEQEVDYIPTANSAYSSIYINYTAGSHLIKIIGAEAGNIIGDLNGDGKVDILDVVIVTSNYAVEETTP